MTDPAVQVAAQRGLKAAAAAMAAGAVASLALPPNGYFLAWLAACPVLVWLLDGAVARNGRSGSLPAFVIGWAFGFGYFLASLYWIGEAFLVDADLFAWLLPVAITAMPTGLALFWGAAAAVAIRFWSTGPVRVMVLAACIAAAEWVRGHVLTGFPWNGPGYATDAVPELLQLAAFTGLYGLNFLVIIWGALAVVALPLLSSDGRSWSQWAWSVVLLASFLAAYGAGLVRLKQADAAGDSNISVRIVQPNIAQKDKWRPENRAAIEARFMALTAQHSSQPDISRDDIAIVVWPESALPVLVDESLGLRRSIARATGPGAVTILGAVRRLPRTAGHGRTMAANSILVLGPDGTILARYDKQKLVPFGEFLPMERYLEPLGLRRLVTLPNGFLAGPGPATLSVAQLPPFAPLICYEVIFPHELIDRSNRPDWMLNVTNDAWFGMSAGPYQHLAQARMRAVEEGLPMIRAANTGISAVIDSYGRVRKALQLGNAGVVDARLPDALSATIYATFGDLTLWIVIALTILGRVRIFLADSD